MNQQQQQQQIDLSLTGEIICENCSNTLFKQVYYLRTVPKTISKSGREEVFPIVTFACEECGHINKNFEVNIKPKIKENKIIK